MPRDYKQQLDDILQAIGFIREYVKDMDYKALKLTGKPRMLLSAILRLSVKLPELCLAGSAPKLKLNPLK